MRLRGLDHDARYAVTAWSSFDEPLGTFERGGDDLMRAGIGIEPPEPMPADAWADGIRIARSDFAARLFDVRRL